MVFSINITQHLEDSILFLCNILVCFTTLYAVFSVVFCLEEELLQLPHLGETVELYKQFLPSVGR